MQIVKSIRSGGGGVTINGQRVRIGAILSDAEVEQLKRVAPKFHIECEPYDSSETESTQKKRKPKLKPK